jgi:pimeloyl-ACP methyl ester carboxylesterase
MDGGIRMIAGGHGEPLLLMLHGLGATGEVWAGWRPWLTDHWPGRWVAPDLPGHGGSGPLLEYTFDGLAVAVAGAVRPGLSAVVVGHSLGGVVGLALAARTPVAVVIGIGIKVEWSDDDLARARAVADRPPLWFDTRDEAATRYLRLSGLTGLIAPDDPTVGSGLSESDGRWRVAMDPRAFAIGAPDMAGLVATAHASIILARGEFDHMNTDEQLARLGAPSVTLAGLGHNAHVESPEVTAKLIEGWR